MGLNCEKYICIITEKKMVAPAIIDVLSSHRKHVIDLYCSPIVRRKNKTKH